MAGFVTIFAFSRTILYARRLRLNGEAFGTGLLENFSALTLT